MATKRNAPGKKKGLNIDFSDTETQAQLPEGDYLMEVDEVEVKTSEKSGEDYLSFTFKVAEGSYSGKKVYHNCSLQPQALFNLRGVLEALGFDVPQGAMDLDPTDLIGEQCGASIQLETYEGKKKPRCVEFFLAAELEAEGEQAEEKAPVKKAPAKKAEPEEEPAEEAPVKKAKKKVAKPAAEPEIEVGSSVTFTDDEGEEQTGKVTAMEEDSVTVTVGTGKKAEEWELSLEDLTLVE